MAKVEGLTALLRDFSVRKAMAKEADTSVSVGYTAAYALWVHEAVGMLTQGAPRPKGRGFYWDPQGQAQAKFLEQPARELSPVLADITRNALQRGAKMPQALLMAGLRLQRESQLLCPVDTGNLKASAFTRLNK